MVKQGNLLRFNVAPNGTCRLIVHVRELGKEA